LCAGSNGVQVYHLNYTVCARKQFDCFQLIVVTCIKNDALIGTADDVRYFDVPILELHDLWSTGIPILTKKRCKLNKVLLKRLIAKNLTGKVGHELLLDYGMSLSWYSYNKRGVEISNTNIDSFDIKTHVYVAEMLCTRYHTARQLKSDFMGNNVFGTLAPVVNMMFEYIVDKLKLDNELVKQGLQLLQDKLSTPVVRNSIGATLKHWDTLDFWTTTNTIILNTVGSETACTHHIKCVKPTTNDMCVCCGFKTAVEQSLCECCSNAYSCQHDLTFHEYGDEKCICCGYDSNASVCNSCDYKLQTVSKQAETDDKPAKKADNERQPSQKPGDIYKNKAGKSCYVPMEPNVEEPDELHPSRHKHRCPKCTFYYTHDHHYDYIQHGIFVGDCPHCENNKESTAIAHSDCKHCFPETKQQPTTTR